MITRLQLRRWRSFDHVAVNFEPGTTFVVAPNGVGKTSLLLGLTWALFGERSHVDAAACVRLGHASAEATVTLAIGHGGHLTIARTVTTTGRTTVDYRDGEAALEEESALALLAEEFGAPIEIAARLAVIRGPGKDAGELQLREHLYDAFGVSGLRRAAASATRLHKQAVAARKKLRSASRSQLSNREQLTTLAAKLEGDLDDLAARRESLAAAVTSALQARQAVTAWEAHDVASHDRAAAIDELLRSAETSGLVGRSLDELAGVVSVALATNHRKTDQAQHTLTEAHAQAFAARTALALLEDQEPSCPTCARPFHGDELNRAIAAQNESLALARDRITSTEALIDQLADIDKQLSSLLAGVQALSRPLVEPTFPRPISDPEAAVVTAQERLRQHDELAGGVAAERAAIVAQLDNDDALKAAYAAEKAAWRREALTQAAAAALTGAAQRLAEEYIEPLSRQVRWRWKALFGEDGLQLRPDGSIVRVVGDRELPWDQLSSGEQIWARLVASLLVLRSSTTLPFAWLDEPLEHLDPRARRIVATDLASTTRSGRPAQMIVTTYEHMLARQLAEDLPDTHLRQINRTEPFVLPSRPSTRANNDVETMAGERFDESA